MKKLKRTLSQSFKRLSFINDDDPGYQSTASPGSGNGYQTSSRSSLPARSLVDLNNVNSINGYNEPFTAPNFNNSVGYDFPLRTEDNRLYQSRQKPQHYNSSNSFMDAGRAYNSSGGAGSQVYSYYQPRNYTSHTLHPHMSMSNHAYYGGGFDNTSGAHNSYHQDIDTSAGAQGGILASWGYIPERSQPHSQQGTTNGKPPPAPVNPSATKTRSKKPGKRATSIADMFSIRRKKSVPNDGKPGPMKAMDKPYYAQEEMFYNIAVPREDYYLTAAAATGKNATHYATMNRTVNGALVTSNPGMVAASSMQLHPAHMSGHPVATTNTNQYPYMKQQSHPPAPHHVALNTVSSAGGHPSSAMPPMGAPPHHQQQLYSQPSYFNGAKYHPVGPSKSMISVCRGSQPNVNTEVNYRTKKRSTVEEDAIRKRHSTPASSICCRNVPYGAKYGKIEDYEKSEVLGEGSYATVYKGKNLNTEMEVALKEIRLNEEEGAPFTAIREASLLKELVHANIVKLFDIIYNKKQLIFVFEYLCTDLNHYLERYGNGGLNPHNVKLFLFQLLRGLSFIHDRKILHRDLKPQNLLISQHGELKLADFGLARAKSVPTQSYSNEVVTLWYRPPDILLGSTQYSTQLDMWGVGCIFCEMVSGLPTFPGVKDPRDQLLKIFRVLGTPDETIWPGVTELPLFKDFKKYRKQNLERFMPKMMLIPYAEELAESLLKCNPVERISARDAMQSKYFKNLPQKLFNLPDEQSIMFVEGVSLEAEREAPRNLMKTYYN